MKKEYTKLTNQKFDENMEPLGEIEEVTITSLIPDTGKKIREKATGILSTRVDLGTGADESDYEEVDDPAWAEITAQYREQLAEEVSRQ